MFKQKQKLVWYDFEEEVVWQVFILMRNLKWKVVEQDILYWKNRDNQMMNTNNNVEA